jgi:hypothetical protein
MINVTASRQHTVYRSGIVLLSVYINGLMPRKAPAMNLFKKKGYVWITLIFFLFSLLLHWIFGWFAFENEQQAHGQPIIFSDYAVEMLRDTFENLQSEFLQLIWQVAGLAFLLYVGSPQSKEGDERKEEKLDYLIKKIDPANYDKLMEEWEKKFPKE